MITKEYVKELHNEWHRNKHIMPSTYEEFIRANTGWDHDQFISWVANGRLP